MAVTDTVPSVPSVELPYLLAGKQGAFRFAMKCKIAAGCGIAALSFPQISVVRSACILWSIYV